MTEGLLGVESAQDFCLRPRHVLVDEEDEGVSSCKRIGVSGLVPRVEYAPLSKRQSVGSEASVKISTRTGLHVKSFIA